MGAAFDKVTFRLCIYLPTYYERERTRGIALEMKHSQKHPAFAPLVMNGAA